MDTERDMDVFVHINNKSLHSAYHKQMPSVNLLRFIFKTLRELHFIKHFKSRKTKPNKYPFLYVKILMQR